jgi:hypothetical protein
MDACDKLTDVAGARIELGRQVGGPRQPIKLEESSWSTTRAISRQERHSVGARHPFHVAGVGALHRLDQQMAGPTTTFADNPGNGCEYRIAF